MTHAVRSFLAMALLLAVVAPNAGAATRDDVEVTVEVRGANGRAVSAAYVAIFSPSDPWSEPTAEAVAPNGKATFRIARGSYVAMVGAKGHAELLRQIRIADAANLRFDLEAASTAHGVVRNGDGQPIEGARVSQLRQVGPLRFAQTTALARELFASEWLTRTDANGRWQLPLRGAVPTPFLVERSGYAPVVTTASAAAEEVSTALAKGATLRLQFDRAEPALVVTLIRTGPATPVGVAPEQQARVWSRSADATTMTWDALPPGTYRVVARADDPKRFGTLRELGTVTLAAGDEQAIRYELPRAESVATNVAVLFVAKKSTSDMTGMKVIASTERGPAELQYSVEPAVGGVLVYLNTAAEASRVFVSTSDSVITATEEVPQAGEPHATVVSPRADVLLRLVAAGDADLRLPAWAAARFESCDPAQPATTALAISRGELATPFPVRCRSLVLELPPPFEPILVNADLKPRESRAFGPYELRPAAAATVRVVREPSGAVVPDATVVVSTRLLGTRDELQLTRSSANEEGIASLRGLPADRELSIEATDPASGASTAVTVRLAPGVVTTIDPLGVPEPARLTVAPTLSPLVRERFPDAAIRRVTLDRAPVAAPKLRRSATLDKDGEAAFDRLRPGKWQPLVVIEAAGFAQPIPLEPVELRPGAELRFAHEIEPPIFHGVVLAAGQPVAGSVGIADQPGPAALTRFFQAAADGRFVAMLPERGIYRVRVTTADRPHEQIEVGEVDFADPAQPVRIELPLGVLTVRVRANEQPVKDAVVRATLRRAGATDLTLVRRTSAEGEARFERVLDGRWLVEARRADRGATAQRVAEVRARETSTIELTLETGATLRGVVHAARGATVSRANVDCVFAAAGDVPQSVRAETDAAGRFAIDLPTPPPNVLRCGVTSDAGAIGVYSTAITDSATFTLPATTGTVTFPDWGTRPAHDRFWLATTDGRVFNLSWAAAKIGRAWSPLVIPSLPAGTWKIVRAESLEDAARLAMAGGAALRPLVEFRLDPGESKVIALYE